MHISAALIVTVCIVFAGVAHASALLQRQSKYYSSFWTDNGETVSYKNGAGGQFSVTWSGTKGNFVCGKGWNTGSARYASPQRCYLYMHRANLTCSLFREVKFNGTFETQGNSYLAIYGWTTNPLVEYYIIENYGSHIPYDTPEAEFKGNVTSDGDSYIIFTKMRKNKPSIQGTATFAQYWSVRNSKRSEGTVTTGNHFKAWQESGLKIGRHNYMIVAVEGQGSNGTANIVVS